ncbi:TrmB family transcriptional regulator [Natronocalculus amylovorans]|uniref:TrmB family transcriptional regulator n=1 Tax=Natronocalculus amylovorans TaxID=2917812 RepID=A0AAE3FWR7_9EURY|nr:TrmB family transcriptional regulator [Natronocalculus amylovorans]MCL9817007.1 TrmB family transcriptional regulator [Natronocalculus amylovorans]NUE02944.1 TrmB family transcriptional regulator [Halorubraceae archaeon YAN]
METQELRQALGNAGLSQYQSEAYITLLRLGSTSATRLADESSVPTARIYDVVRDLEDKGYVETYEQDSLHARANNPEVVLEDLRGRAELLSTAAKEIETRWEEPTVDEHKLSIVKRFETVFDHATRAIEGAENEVQVSLSVDHFAALRPALKKAYENDVVIKVSIHTAVVSERPTLPTKMFEGVATEVRYRPLPTPFIALVDRTEACFAPTGGSLNQYGVLVNDRTLTYVFHWYFLTCLWEVWEEIYSVRSEAPPILYTDIRRCVRDIEPLITAGDTVRVTVEGYDTGSGAEKRICGIVTDVAYAGASQPGEAVPLAQLAGQVTLYVEDETGNTHTVGGWGAVVEDTEATRITVVDVAPVQSE